MTKKSEKHYTRARLLNDLKWELSQVNEGLNKHAENNPGITHTDYPAWKSTELAIRRKIYCITTKISNVQQKRPINGYAGCAEIHSLNYRVGE